MNKTFIQEEQDMYFKEKWISSTQRASRIVGSKNSRVECACRVMISADADHFRHSRPFERAVNFRKFRNSRIQKPWVTHYLVGLRMKEIFMA